MKLNWHESDTKVMWYGCDASGRIVAWVQHERLWYMGRWDTYKTSQGEYITKADAIAAAERMMASRWQRRWARLRSILRGAQ